MGTVTAKRKEALLTVVGVPYLYRVYQVGAECPCRARGRGSRAPLSARRCPGGLCAWLSGVSVATCARGLNNAIMDPTMPFWIQPICGRGDRLQTTTECSAVR
jgi:hypothetical protein